MRQLLILIAICVSASACTVNTNAPASNGGSTYTLDSVNTR